MIIEYKNRYVLGLGRQPLKGALYDAARSAAVFDLTGGVALTVTGPLRLTPPGESRGDVRLPLEDIAQFKGAGIAAAVAFKSGRLRIVFSTGHFLQGDDSHEVEVQVCDEQGTWSWRGGVVTSPQVRFSLDEEAGAWTLPIDRVAVDRLIIDAALTIEFENGWMVKLECPFTFTDAIGSEHELVPDYDAVELAPVLALKRAVGRAGRMFTDGRLEVSFVDGSAIHVSVDENFDAWTVHGPDGVELVSAAGGGLEISGAGPSADGSAPTRGH